MEEFCAMIKELFEKMVVAILSPLLLMDILWMIFTGKGHLFMTSFLQDRPAKP